MRGRAIRIDRNVPDKVANIWHLATVEPQATGLWQSSVSLFAVDPNRTFETKMAKLGSDARLLCKRFEMFEGITNGDSDLISNGINRLGFVEQIDDIADRNNMMLETAKARSEIAERWRRSLGDPEQRSHVHKIAEANYAPSKQSYVQTLQYLSITGVLGGFTSAAGAMREFQSVQIAATLCMILGGMTMLYSIPKLYLASRLFFRNGTLERSLKQVSDALLDSLFHVGALAHPKEYYAVEVEASIRGNQNIILHHASRAEERIFLDGLTEILGPIANPRYLLIRKSWFGWLVRKDYHAVPTMIGKKRDDAEYFAQRWSKYVGDVDLVFTRQKSGRRTLIHARANALSAGFHRFVDRRSQWR